MLDVPGAGASRLVLTEKQATEELGLSARTLQAMRTAGTGPAFIRLSERRIGYSREALQAWIAARSVKSTSEATVRRLEVAR